MQQEGGVCGQEGHPGRRTSRILSTQRQEGCSGWVRKAQVPSTGQGAGERSDQRGAGFPEALRSWAGAPEHGSEAAQAPPLCLAGQTLTWQIQVPSACKPQVNNDFLLSLCPMQYLEPTFTRSLAVYLKLAEQSVLYLPGWGLAETQMGHHWLTVPAFSHPGPWLAGHWLLVALPMLG